MCQYPKNKICPEEGEMFQYSLIVYYFTIIAIIITLLIIIIIFWSLLIADLALKVGQPMQHLRPRDDLTQTAK